jgi:hypothetical protein
MATSKKAPKKESTMRSDIFLRLIDKTLKPRVEKLSAKMGFESINRVSEVALTIGIAVMENPYYWHARIDGVSDHTIAEYINDGLAKRAADKKKARS